MIDTIKILAIDDDQTITRLIRRILGKEGYEVVEINDSQKVEDYLLYTSLGLVITDYMMPGLNGLQVLELVKKSNPNLPVLFLTGQGTIETAVEATKAGATVFLTKPFQKDDLVQAVKTHALIDQMLPDEIRETIESSALADDGSDLVSPDKILLADEIAATDSIPDGLVELKFEDILPGQILPFDLYLQIYNRKNKRHYLRKICSKNTVFTTGLKEILEKRKLGNAYIKDNEYDAFLEYLNAIKSSPGFQHQKVKDRKKLLLYGKAVEAVTTILNEPGDNKNIKSAVDLVDGIFQVFVNDPVTYQDMFKLFKRDTNIFNHSANTCLLSVSFGLYMGLNQKVTQVLGLGSLFHDVGMNRMDKRVLEKRGPLNPVEWADVKKHPERGMALLKSSNLLPLTALRIVLEHHEIHDGSGYPRGIKGNQIHRLSHLARLIDKYDALTTNKPYREAFNPAEALKRIYLEESSESFRGVIRLFIAFLGGQDAKAKSSAAV